LKKGGLLSTPKHGVLQITDRGMQVLKQNPDRVDVKVLQQFPEFLEFQKPKQKPAFGIEPVAVIEGLDPQENIEVGLPANSERIVC
jgi:restriction system protein